MIRAPTKIPIAHTDNWIPPRSRHLGSAGTYDRGSLKTDRRFLCPFTGKPHLRQKGVLWNFSTAQSAYYRLWLSLLEQDLAFGALSISWRATEMIIRAQMLMYGREAQSKTKTASPATIPKSGERNRKIHSCVLYLISIWTYQADTAISLLAVNARLPIVRRKQEYRKGIKISNFFVTKFRFLRLTYEAEGGDDKYGLWKAL